MSINEVRFFHSPAVTAPAQNATPAVRSTAWEQSPVDQASLQTPAAASKSAGPDLPSQAMTSAAQSLTAQGGLPLVPSAVPTVLLAISSGTTQKPTLFIGSELRPAGSASPAAAKSLITLAASSELTAAANHGGGGGGGKGFEKGEEKGREKGSEKGEEKGREKGEEKGFEKGEEKGREKGEEKGEEKGREKGSEKGEEKGREKGSEKGEEKGREKGSEKGEEKGHEKGSEKGTEKGHEKGSEKGTEKNHEKGSEKGTEKNHEKGGEKGTEKNHEKGGEKGSEKNHEKGGEKGSEKNHEKGGEKPGEHPVHPTPPTPRPPHAGPPPATGRPSLPTAPPTKVIHDGGHDFKVPTGGWVTNAQRQHPDLHTGVIDRNRDWRNQITNVQHWHDQDCGPNWYNNPHGFYCGNDFWYGFDLGQEASWDWSDDPVYCVSPVTGDDIGQITPPDGGFSDQDAAYQAVLNTMASPTQDPNDPSYDPTAGLYAGTQDFDPTNPGAQLSGDDAFQALSSGQPIYFHPPNGDWEALNSLDDLNAYLYTMEQQPQDGSGATTDPGTAIPQLDPQTTLSLGDGLGSDGPSAAVTVLQERLAAAGNLTSQPDGEFGAQTQTALKAFQAAQGLTVDGIAGPATIAALNQVSQN